MTADDRALREQLLAGARDRLRRSLEREADALEPGAETVRADLDAWLARLRTRDGERTA